MFEADNTMVSKTHQNYSWKSILRMIDIAIKRLYFHNAVWNTLFETFRLRCNSSKYLNSRHKHYSRFTERSQFTVKSANIVIELRNRSGQSCVKSTVMPFDERKLTWYFMRDTSGDITRSNTSGAAWKIRDFPEPVGRTTKTSFPRTISFKAKRCFSLKLSKLNFSSQGHIHKHQNSPSRHF